MKAELERFTPSYAHLLPKTYEPGRLITGALLSIQNNPDLLKCDPRSVAVALGRIARWGLDPGETAHLVPFGNVCTAVADYKGLVVLMVRGGARKVDSDVVRQGDQFRWGKGFEPFLQHLPEAKHNAPITHGYGLAVHRNGERYIEVMALEEIDQVREKYSRSWKKGESPLWYCRKTPLRRLAKYFPKTPELEAALSQDGREAPPPPVRDAEAFLATVTADGEVLGNTDPAEPEAGAA